MFLQYFRPQLYSGGTRQAALRDTPASFQNRLAVLCALWDIPGFIPGHGLPHFGTPPASFRDTAFRIWGRPWLHSGTRPSALWDTPASFRDTLTVIRNHILEFSRTLPEMRFDTAGNTGDPHRKSSGGLPAGSPSPCLQSDFTSSPNRFLLHPQSHFNAFSIL